MGVGRPIAIAALALGTAVSAAACSSSGSGSTQPSQNSAATTNVTVPASLVAKAKANPLSPYPSQSTSVGTVTIGQSVPTMSFAPLEVAKAMNFFGYLGVKVNYSTLESGTAMQEAVVGGSINVGADASTDVAEMIAKGLPGVAVANVMPMTLQVCVNKSWAQQHGLSPAQPLIQRVAGLKGAAFGITGPGALSDAAGRWLVKTYGGIDPDTGITSITVGSSSLAPSVDANKIQAFLQSAPTCEETSNGEVLIGPSEVPQWKNYANEVLFTTQTYARSNTAAMTRVATAVDMGAKFIATHPQQAITMLEKLYPSKSPSTISAAFQAGIAPSLAPNVDFNSTMWENVNSILVGGGTISKPISTAPNTSWTNQYIDSAAATVY
jgi:ABC-type nitrate/sulfonate/bicarbonate transport system substrate-binding protein